MTRRLLVLALLGAAAMAVPANAGTIVTVRNPANGCTYTVWGPDVTVGQTGGSPKPGVRTEGGFGESVSCP